MIFAYHKKIMKTEMEKNLFVENWVILCINATYLYLELKK